MSTAQPFEASVSVDSFDAPDAVTAAVNLLTWLREEGEMISVIVSLDDGSSVGVDVNPSTMTGRIVR